MSLTLQNKPSSNFSPVSDGVHSAVCVGVIEKGPTLTTFQGQTKTVNKLNVIWEVEETTEAGARKTISKSYTASLHPKAQLAKDIGGWRGKPVGENESIDLTKLLGASCTLVISTTEAEGGKKFTNVTAISKPTKKLTASGAFDIRATTQRLREWSAKNNPKHDDAVFAAQLGEKVAATEPASTAAPAPKYDPELGF